MKHQECEKETLLHYKQYEERELYMTEKTSNTNLSLWDHVSAPILSTNLRAKSDQLLTCRVDGRNSRVGGKVVKNIKQRNWGTAMEHG